MQEGGPTVYIVPQSINSSYNKSPTDKTLSLELSQMWMCTEKGWRQEEEVTEEPKRVPMQEMTRGFSSFKEALLVLEAQDPDMIGRGI